MKKEYYFILQRLFDLVVTVLASFITAPLIIVVSLFVKINSKGPIIYKQIRVGYRGREFLLYKFRSMVLDAESETGPVLSHKEDKRVTLVGKILRRTRLDEIPQFINVFKGDMSIVGPRPERPYFVSRHKYLQGLRLSVRPGITGLAQVNAAYNIHPRNKLRFDYVYIKNQSLLLDIWILLRTIMVVFTSSGS